MALSFRYTIVDVSGGYYVPVTTGSYSLRASPFSASTYAGSHVANGSWNFGVVADGVYQLWNEGTPAQVASFGEVQLVDSAISSIGITLPSNLDANSKKIVSLADGTATGDAVNYGQVVRNTGDQSIAGVKTFTSLPFTGPITPSSNYQLSTKKYVDDKVAAVTTNSFQESINKVRVFPDGTETTDQVYLSILKGVTSFAAPASDNLCLASIEGMNVGNTYISAEVNSLVSYVNLKGVGKHIWVMFNDVTETAVTTLEDMTIIFGTAGGVYGARSYNSMTFENCIIYHYHNVTLTNCVVRNCLFLGSSSYAVTVDGSTKVINSQFNNALVKAVGFSGITPNVTDGFTYAPPTDPTTP